MITLPTQVVTHFANWFKILNAKPVGGGCINDCYHLETSSGHFFLKLNSAAAFPGMFESEFQGLNLLASAKALKIPATFETGEIDGLAFLLMEFIQKGPAKKNSMLVFGQRLAALHTKTEAHFGLDHDNYLGSLKQYNAVRKLWPEFFIEMRLQPQLKLAFDRHLVNAETVKNFDKLFTRMASLFPDEKPSLLHGDLWSGNYMIDEHGFVCILDPAVYYGNREMDIAMTRLFGNFDQAFYDGYNEMHPLQQGWDQRVGLCNLYPLLVHINLFGAGYVNQLATCLKQYI
ncbi:MAG: ketosamine-3-kinase [Bacteroidota bacterium]|nr:ketosamine-3-kinase [Bacteroidota bacterium]